MLKKTFLLLAGLAMTFAVQAQDFLGAWSGKLDLGAAKLQARLGSGQANPGISLLQGRGGQVEMRHG